jgi:iron complex outermembrane receptor protein
MPSASMRPPIGPSLSHRCTTKVLWMIAPVLACGAALPALADDSATEPAAMGPMQEVVITATRREQDLSKVPISVTALTQEDMDTKGIKDITDVARFTPGIYIDNSGTNNISIRGISSSGGAGTTGIYIDDTPIQMRALAFNPDETLPKSFDVERVEVLRGPQGTLFGAGSEGGTVRYITAQPSLTRTSIYGRSELSYTEGGTPALSELARPCGTGATAAGSTESIPRRRTHRARSLIRTQITAKRCSCAWRDFGR